ncbi:MAG: ABC transporter substrate-binding protein [Rhodobacter sp.]|nr:ABC transporter substrate-binding protein [Paracoccaceae bacterium]MCB1410758.1 ABC transporter substrate-binding protein [Paracoccaceae bacterium]MCC0081333.1 ABC transporter substrate-binding protein [Rhodobacter sp.]
MPISDTRRRVLAGLATVAALPLLPRSARAMTQAQARALIDQVMGDVQGIINSGASESRMIARFEDLFDRYGDVPIIARSALGPPARSASSAQMSAFTAAFRGYLARKYGRQFRRFIGATADVQDAHPLQSFWEVVTTMTMRGQAPFEVRWHVSDRSGGNRFFNLIIGGVNVLAAERQEIGTMLERRGGNLDRMIQDLRQAG